MEKDKIMVNIIWGIFIVIGVVFSIINGESQAINEEILVSAKTGLNLILEMLPILVIWMGLMQIAQDSGLIVKMANFLSKPLKKIFPSIPKGNPALGLIASNVAVNMMGLGSAATPFGLKAMEELQKINPKKDTASEAMVTFLVLNTSGVTIIPTTVIALRMLYGSANPTEIIITSLLATASATIAGLTMDYIIRKKRHHE